MHTQTGPSNSTWDQITCWQPLVILFYAAMETIHGTCNVQLLQLYQYITAPTCILEDANNISQSAKNIYWLRYNIYYCVHKSNTISRVQLLMLSYGKDVQPPPLSLQGGEGSRHSATNILLSPKTSDGLYLSIELKALHIYREREGERGGREREEGGSERDRKADNRTIKTRLMEGVHCSGISLGGHDYLVSSINNTWCHRKWSKSTHSSEQHNLYIHTYIHTHHHCYVHHPPCSKRFHVILTMRL